MISHRGEAQQHRQIRQKETGRSPPSDRFTPVLQPSILPTALSMTSRCAQPIQTLCVSHSPNSIPRLDNPHCSPTPIAELLVHMPSLAPKIPSVPLLLSTLRFPSLCLDHTSLCDTHASTTCSVGCGACSSCLHPGGLEWGSCDASWCG